MEKMSKSERSVKKKKILLIISISIVGIYLLTGIIYVAAVMLGYKNYEVSIDELKNNNGIVLLDKDFGYYNKLKLEDSDWIIYDSIPDEFKHICRVKSGLSDAAKSYLSYISGHNISITYSSVIVREAYRNGRLSDNYASSVNQLKLSLYISSENTEEMLSEYLLNTIYLGNGVYGIAKGAKAYFLKNFQQLTGDELEKLAKIVEEAVLQESYPDKNRLNKEASYFSTDAFTDGLSKTLVNELVKRGISEDNAVRKLYFAGGTVYTTIDSNIQKLVNDRYNKEETFTNDNTAQDIQSSIVIMDYDGALRAVRGGRDNNTVINRALSVKRQIGSTIKPFAIYAPALENGLISFSTVFEDKQMIIEQDGQYIMWPHNADSNYGGQYTVTEALWLSKNTIAVQIGSLLGEEKIYDFLTEKLMFNELSPTYDNNNLSALAMGYLHTGISLDKLASCYTMFGNGGIYTEPYMYSIYISDSGNTILENSSSEIKAISEETAAIMNRLLLNNVREEKGTAHSAAIDGMEVLGKTGTVGTDTDEVKCQFFVGMTSEYIAAIWVGMDDEDETLSFKNYRQPVSIWKDIMEEVDSKADNFILSDNVVMREYCTKTGMLAGDGCKDTAIGWYAKNALPDNCSECK